jgi:hypothetical protein
MVAVPPGRAARPEDCVLSRARISLDTNAPCVLASERPSHPGDEHHPANPSYARGCGIFTGWLTPAMVKSRCMSALWPPASIVMSTRVWSGTWVRSET